MFDFEELAQPLLFKESNDIEIGIVSSLVESGHLEAQERVENPHARFGDFTELTRLDRAFNLERAVVIVPFSVISQAYFAYGIVRYVWHCRNNYKLLHAFAGAYLLLTLSLVLLFTGYLLRLPSNDRHQFYTTLFECGFPQYALLCFITLTLLLVIASNIVTGGSLWVDEMMSCLCFEFVYEVHRLWVPHITWYPYKDDNSGEIDFNHPQNSHLLVSILLHIVKISWYCSIVTCIHSMRQYHYPLLWVAVVMVGVGSLLRCFLEHRWVNICVVWCTFAVSVVFMIVVITELMDD